jgi:hypothetical protein
VKGLLIKFAENANHKILFYMKTIWDERYNSPDYIYGTEPNEYFRLYLSEIAAGKLLLPGEGEGRNAVFAARSGWEADAFDASSEGKRKALKLAELNHTRINYTVSDISDYPYPENHYDLVGIFFVHLPFPVREFFHKKLISSLKPRGKIIMECFEKEQINLTSGGPKSLELLYDLDEIRSEFTGLNFIELQKKEIFLNEGLLHQGPALVIRMLAEKSYGPAEG